MYPAAPYRHLTCCLWEPSAHRPWNCLCSCSIVRLCRRTLHQRNAWCQIWRCSLLAWCKMRWLCVCCATFRASSCQCPWGNDSPRPKDREHQVSRCYISNQAWALSKTTAHSKIYTELRTKITNYKTCSTAYKGVEEWFFHPWHTIYMYFWPINVCSWRVIHIHNNTHATEVNQPFQWDPDTLHCPPTLCRPSQCLPCDIIII